MKQVNYRHLLHNLGSAGCGIRSVFLDFLFPPSCIACTKAIDQYGGFCAACWKELNFIERPYCLRLGTPFSQDLGSEGLISPQALADPPVFNRARAVIRYEDGPGRRILHRLKYWDKTHLAQPLAEWMVRAGEELLNEAQLLIPIPLHRQRLRERRFNQSMLLAQAISFQTGIPVEANILVRRKYTRPQVGLSRSARATNLQGAFYVDQRPHAKLVGRKVLVIDDVLTSGATANAASRALLRAGADSVDVLVFARVVYGT